MGIRRRVITTTLLVVALCVGLLSGTAMAGTATGSWGFYGPQAGIAYANRNQIWTASPSTARGLTEVETTNGVSAPTGYIGIIPRSYKNGVLCQQAGWQYNVAGTTYMSFTTSTTSCGSGVYKSNGRTAAWTGTSYNTYSSFDSPNQNL